MIEIPVRVKDALRENNLRKNYRFNVLNDDKTVDFTIDNNNLVSEKVSFDERLASGDQLKFGLCEGTSLEFQYFGLPDINNRQLQVFIDVEYKNIEGQKQWYTIPMGFFIVKKCPMQFSTGIRKVTAYNKLMSDYLDSDMTTEIKDLILEGTEGNSNELPISMALADLLSGFSIVTNYKNIKGQLASVNAGGGIINYITLYYRDENRVKTKKLHYYNYRVDCKIDGISESNVCQFIIKVYNIANAIYNKFQDYFENEQYYTDSDCTKSFFEHVKESERMYGVYARIKKSDGTSKWEPITKNVFKDAFYDGNTEVKKLLTNIIYYQEASLDEPHNVGITVPCIMQINDENLPTWTDADVKEGKTEMVETLRAIDWGSANIIQSSIGEMRLTTQNMAKTSQITIRELQSAVYELDCQFGKLDRQTDLFSGVELNNSVLYPRDTLYPQDTLYPSGIKERSIKSAYSQLWTDDGGEQSFRYLIITYKGLDENNNEKDFMLLRTINTHGTTNYNMSDNWLFRNMIWTAEQIGEFADAMVLKMKNIKWFPFEMWGSGLPYIETGDEIEIIDKQGKSHTSYILKRTLDGIQNLQDTYANGIVDVF